MKVTTSRDENDKRIRVRAYRCEPTTDFYWRKPSRYSKPHQGNREKARRAAR